ncbi:MAG TPA: J domain-containing protein, partial [Kofleriaceae bacterium]|nr:J domain-containing protein [Kofleriaceae bacterium]
MAGASPAARAQRVKASGDRGAKVKQERSAKEAREKAAADEAFRRMKYEAGQGGAAAPPRPSSGSGSSSARPPRPGSTEAQVADWYRVLDLAPGSDMAAVKSNYRKLMRKYHPDLHAHDDRKQKAANELSMRVTTAYNGLQAHLAGESK